MDIPFLRRNYKYFDLFQTRRKNHQRTVISYQFR